MPVWKMLPSSESAGLFNSTILAAPSTICASAGCRTSLTFPVELVPILCLLTATCSPSCLLVTAPSLTGCLLSSSAVLDFASWLIAPFTYSWAWSRKEFASHIVCISLMISNSKWSTCVATCWLSHLLRAGLTIFVKRFVCFCVSRHTNNPPKPLKMHTNGAQ